MGFYCMSLINFSLVGREHSCHPASIADHRPACQEFQRSMPPKHLSQVNVMLNACRLLFLHWERNPGYFWQEQFILMVEVFKRQGKFLSRQCLWGNLKPRITSVLCQRPWSHAGTLRDLEIMPKIFGLTYIKCSLADRYFTEGQYKSIEMKHWASRNGECHWEEKIPLISSCTPPIF